MKNTSFVDQAAWLGSLAFACGWKRAGRYYLGYVLLVLTHAGAREQVSVAAPITLRQSRPPRGAFKVEG